MSQSNDERESRMPAQRTRYPRSRKNAADGTGIAKECIQYCCPGGEKEDYYLFFGKNSIHMLENEGSVDGTALDAARCLLDLYR